jgi:drug/metabolite transporter (DMT)-like permease
VAEPIIRVPEEPQRRRPLAGYAMVWTAAILFALNGTISKVALGSGLSTIELTQVRSAGACVGFALVLALVRPGSLRVRRRELPFLVVFGVAGVAFVQWLYFVAIDRLPVGIALLIQYLAPLMVALFARYAMHEPVRRRIWVALALSLAGLALIVEPWAAELALDELGLVAALAAAGAYAVYILMAERGVRTRDPISLSCYGFLFAALFWFVVQPVWLFPAGHVAETTSLLGNLARFEAPLWTLLVFVVAVGTMLTFALIVSALRHISATRVGIVAMLEPVTAALIAYLWLAESLGPVQLTGAAVVLGAILLAQTAR